LPFEPNIFNNFDPKIQPELSQRKIVSQLLVLATPIIAQNLVQYIQLQVDMSMLGRYNIHFLAAVGNVIFPYTFLYSFLSAISTGATILIAYAIGSGTLKRAKRYSEVSFFYNILFSIPMFLILFLGSDSIMHIMGASAEVAAQGSVFMKNLSFSFIAFGIELSIVAILQGMGRTHAIMYAAILRTIVNIVLDWVLIYGRLGFPEMGIQGAALATTIANFSAALFFIIYYQISKKLSYKPGLKGIFKPRWSIQKHSIVVGLPYGLEAMLWCFGQLVLIRLVNMIDPYAAGSFILINRIQAVAFFFYIGLARGTLTMVGQKMGAGNTKEALHIGLISLRLAMLICIIAATIFVSIPKQILSVFTTDSSVIQELYPYIYLIALTIFPVSVNVVIGNAIRGMKDTKWMFYTQIFGTLFTISMSAVLLFVFHFKLVGIFITILADETIRAALNYWRFSKVKSLKPGSIEANSYVTGNI
jgi:putative MATE family efflux protein